MNARLHVSYHHVMQTPALDELVGAEAAKLDEFFDGIISTRVVIERERQRGGAPFHVRIELEVPGSNIIVSNVADAHEAPPSDDEVVRVRKRPEVDEAHKDPALAVRDAFRKARRQLQDYARR